MNTKSLTIQDHLQRPFWYLDNAHHQKMSSTSVLIITLGVSGLILQFINDN